MCSPEIWDLNGFLLSSEQNKIWRFCKSRFLEIKILKQPFLFTYLYSNGQYGILCVDTFTLIVCRTIDCLFASLRFEHIIKWRLVLTYTRFKYVRFQYIFLFYIPVMSYLDLVYKLSEFGSQGSDRDDEQVSFLFVSLGSIWSVIWFYFKVSGQ